MTTFPGIPHVPPGPPPLVNFLTQVKLSLELLTGQRGGPQPYILTSYSVAALPPANIGGIAYAYDGRKVGESAGNGTGVMIYSDRTKWVACDSSLAVTK